MTHNRKGAKWEVGANLIYSENWVGIFFSYLKKHFSVNLCLPKTTLWLVQDGKKDVERFI